MDNLFKNKIEPLASSLRPTSIEDILGQSKTINLLKKINKPLSLIFYGDTGTGKTTIAKILSKIWKLPFEHLNAISTNVKEIGEIISKAKQKGTIILFLDEIHRFNSARQDILLEAIESGEIILIGATTENPAFRVNKSILSRCQIFKLEKLDNESLLKIYKKALVENKIRKIEAKGIDLLINISNGDARNFLNNLDLISSLDTNEEEISFELVDEVVKTRILNYDKGNEMHYDAISAFIKSIRGSDPDAALFYLSIMLEGGEDPIFIMRRLLISASEDIGNASIYAIMMAESGLGVLERIGMPEGRIILAQVTCFLASCPKSNASYIALSNAQEFIQKNPNLLEIPKHLRNAPTFLHKKDGNSKEYKYTHDFEDGFVVENYFPEKLKDNPPQFYFPKDHGTDKILKERLKKIWEKSGLKKYE